MTRSIDQLIIPPEWPSKVPYYLLVILNCPVSLANHILSMDSEFAFLEATKAEFLTAETSLNNFNTAGCSISEFGIRRFIEFCN